MASGFLTSLSEHAVAGSCSVLVGVTSNGSTSRCAGERWSTGPRRSLKNGLQDSLFSRRPMPQLVTHSVPSRDRRGLVVLNGPGKSQESLVETQEVPVSVSVSVSDDFQSESANLWTRDGANGDPMNASASREQTSGRSNLQASVNGNGSATSTSVLDRSPMTGGAVDHWFTTAPLTMKPLVKTKKIVLVRHGLSIWNSESRIQGSTDLSLLSDAGVAQAEMCKEALKNYDFDVCYASPISRARTSAEVMWSGRSRPLIYLDTLKEASLLFLEGMRNADAKVEHPVEYRMWREDPMNFQVNGVFPVLNVWRQAKEAWEELLSCESELILVVTHKSILRALICTALGMGPDRFRSMDINNGGICKFTVNTRGEPMLQALNLTAHLHSGGVYY